jgi:hypothetical protein
MRAPPNRNRVIVCNQILKHAAMTSPSTDHSISEEISLHRHLQHDRQLCDYLRQLHVPRLCRATICAWWECQCGDMFPGDLLGHGSEAMPQEREQEIGEDGDRGYCR